MPSVADLFYVLFIRGPGPAGEVKASLCSSSQSEHQVCPHKHGPFRSLTDLEQRRGDVAVSVINRLLPTWASIVASSRGQRLELTHVHQCATSRAPHSLNRALTKTVTESLGGGECLSLFWLSGLKSTLESLRNVVCLSFFVCVYVFLFFFSPVS